MSSETLPIQTSDDVVRVRQRVRQRAVESGFSLVDQTKIITAASELARNALIYGGGGRMDWELLKQGIRSGLKLVFADDGPGIANMELAMTDGWTSGNGLGMGQRTEQDERENEMELHAGLPSLLAISQNAKK